MESGSYSIRVSVLLALKEIYHVDTFDEFFGIYRFYGIIKQH